jgi:hypothetical protein
MTLLIADEEVRDFTRARKRVLFKIDDDVFEAAPAMPAATAFEFLAAVQDIGKTDGAAAGEKVRLIVDTFKKILKQESAERFERRMADVDQPVEIPQVTEVMLWLLERYGLRPTRPSSESSPGSDTPAPGTSSTDGASSPGSTPSFFPSTAS